MKTGSQMVAPEGWGALMKGMVYHLLRSDPRTGRVLIVYFEFQADRSNPKANLLVLPRKSFEAGIDAGAIVPAPHQSTLPPWLEECEGIDLAQLDQFRSKAKIDHGTRVEKRFLHISPAVQDRQTILAAPDPEAEINRRARLCQPPQNESRFRLWFLTYLCFGQEIWMLVPPYHRIGHWDRTQHPDTKFGAPSIAYGKHYGNGMSPELIEKCITSYLKRAKLGKHMTKIYEEAMIGDFDCRVATNSSGMKAYYHPKGESFPTYWQFRYRVHQKIGADNVQKTLYGAARHRTRIATSRGRYSEEVANLMERIEADGYYIKERPKGYVDGTTLPPMCVVVSRDVLSGKKLGIGFSFGAERATAYQMMLFCMAVPKGYFCRLFGVPFVPGEWNNEGLPGHFGIDRGPGARKDLIQEMERRFPIRDMAPSWAGQSKATVESSHPRDLKIEGEPSYIQSDLTPVALAKREIIRLIEFNNGSCMEGRFDPDSELAFVTPSPIGLWNYYESRFRNDAQPMRVDEAVRTFLTPTEFLIREDGIYLKGRRYSSPELEKTGVLNVNSIAKGVRTRIQGYVLDMCVRHAWVEVSGQLILLDAMLRIRGDEETLWMSVAELEQWEEARRVVLSAFRVHQNANSSEYRQRFVESTGKSWDAGQRRTGKPASRATARSADAGSFATPPKKNAA